MQFIKIKREIVFAALILIIIVMSYLTWASIPVPECSHISYIESYIDIKSTGGKSYIGLNADRDALKFGGISSGGTALRSIKVRNTIESEVLVSMEGELAEWTEIIPNKFTIEKDQSQDVYFKVSVPEYAFDGNYTGRVKLCFR